MIDELTQRVICFKATNDQQALNLKFTKTCGDFLELAFWQCALGSQECATLADPSSYIAPVHLLNVTGHQTLNTIVNSVNCVTTIDRVPDKGTNSGIHTTSWCTNVHHTECVTFLALSLSIESILWWLQASQHFVSFQVAGERTSSQFNSQFELSFSHGFSDGLSAFDTFHQRNANSLVAIE